jgi:predicted transcriptional regulator
MGLLLQILILLVILLVILFYRPIKQFVLRKELKISIKKLEKLEASKFVNKKVPCLEPDDCVLEAIELFVSNYTNIIVVRSSGRARGIVTKKILLQAISQLDRESLEKMKIEKIMKKDFDYCSSSSTLGEVHKKLMNSKYDAVLVVNRDLYVGTIAYSDMLSLFRGIKFIIKNPPMIKNAIIGKINKISSRENLAGLIKNLVKNDSEYALILEGGKILGIVTLKDVVAAVNKDSDLNKCLVKDFMSRRVLTMNPGTSLYEAFETLLVREFNQIPVVEEGKVIGITDLKRIVGNYYNFLIDVQNSTEGELINSLRILSDRED